MPRGAFYVDATALFLGIFSRCHAVLTQKVDATLSGQTGAQDPILLCSVFKKSMPRLFYAKQKRRFTMLHWTKYAKGQVCVSLEQGQLPTIPVDLVIRDDDPLRSPTDEEKWLFVLGKEHGFTRVLTVGYSMACLREWCAISTARVTWPCCRWTMLLSGARSPDFGVPRDSNDFLCSHRCASLVSRKRGICMIRTSAGRDVKFIQRPSFHNSVFIAPCTSRCSGKDCRLAFEACIVHLCARKSRRCSFQGSFCLASRSAPEGCRGSLCCFRQTYR